ncbi:helix-turn-helix family protein (plasmid) [Clostridium botulinum 202F]|uniref:helix-turn-helix domain-containing protein n=1 Tax=Clostridium cagae TaxID=2080751 RepID=UPI000540A852|nr:helix-turn-helix family protein [Clostridium botulinum 202F]KAI3344475.1 helix-turn-helix domain-containing protein [Clostridium botulinum]KON13520.1 XRE family transcriptional regulator [Clostridium botulinum]MBY6987897.1 helix-turn-helix transcriptional regulator [Clostridium botulinum]NFH01495.1 helix-turn-helix transcriptional regulator [Clostridium botulinum]
MTFGDRLKELREDNGLRQTELADKLNLSRNAISAYETNTNEPNLDILVKFADIFNVSLDYLLCRTKEKYNLNLENNTNKELLLKICDILSLYKIEKK